MQTPKLPAALAEISRGRDFVTTDECARAFNRSAQTVRKNHCLTGEAFGIRPRKIAGRLLWPVADIARVLAGEEAR